MAALIVIVIGILALKATSLRTVPSSNTFRESAPRTAITEGELFNVPFMFDGLAPRHMASSRTALENSASQSAINMAKLTIDRGLQYHIGRTLERLIDAESTRRAWAAVEWTKTGEILALVSVGLSVTSALVDIKDCEPTSRAIAELYRPGSALGPLVIAAALNEGLVTTNSVINCEKGTLIADGLVLESVHPYGMLTVVDVVRKYDAIGVSKIAAMLGPERLERYLWAFGFGQNTGIEVPGERRGTYRPVSVGSMASVANVALGSDIAVTSLQVLRMYSTLANGGVLNRASIRNDGDHLRREVSRPIREQTSFTMRGILAGTVDVGGVGRLARLERFAVAGMPGALRGWPVETNASLSIMSFVGFLPADDPTISLIVALDSLGPELECKIITEQAFKEIAEAVANVLELRQRP